MKRKLFFLILILMLFTGCDTYKDLDKIGLVSLLQIDKKENDYLLSFDIITPTKEDEQKRERLQITCSNLDTCRDTLYLESNHRIYLEHLELLVLTNRITKEDLPYLINFFLEQKNSRTSFPVIMQKELLKEGSTTDEILRFIEVNQEEMGILSIVSFDDIIQTYLQKDPIYLPYLAFSEKEKALGMMGMLDENDLLNKEESILYNFFLNQTKTVSFFQEDTQFSIIDSSVDTKVSEKEITITINSSIQILSCEENKIKLKRIYEEYLQEKLKSLLDNHLSSYFDHLWKRHQPFSKERKEISFQFHTNIEKIQKEAFLCKIK